MAEAPRLYDAEVTYTKSCGRDRETRACTSKLMYLKKPKVVLEHTVALSPVAPKEIPAEVPAPAEGEEAAEPAEPGKSYSKVRNKKSTVRNKQFLCTESSI